MSVKERNSPSDLYEAQAQRLLAEHLVVAGVFVDAKFNLLFSRGEVHRYLDMAEGLPTVDLLSLARQPLKARLRKNLREVFANGGSLCARNIALSDNGQKRHVRVTVTRVDLKQRPEPCAFVVFEDEPPSLAPVAETEDMQNLLLSADIATLFLDEDYCVQRFTPKSEQLFRLTASDVGRPLSDLSPRFEDPSLLQDIRLVVDRLSVSEKEVRGEDGRWFLRRILPYRTQANQIKGVVITFYDISDLKEAQLQAKESEMSWRRLLEDADLLVALTEGAEQKFVFGNRCYVESVGRQVVGLTLREAFTDLVEQDLLDKNDQVYRTGEPIITPELSATYDCHATGQVEERWYNHVLQPWFHSDGSIRGVMTLAVDITPQKKAELALQKSALRLKLALDAAHLGIYYYDVVGGAITFDERARQMFGMGAESSLSLEVLFECMHDEDVEPVKEFIQRSSDPALREMYETEYRIAPLDGSAERVISAHGIVSFTDDSAQAKATAFIGTVRDVSEWKQNAINLLEAKEAVEAAKRAKTVCGRMSSCA
jgi:PAS domain S-box-containing protein